MMMTMTTKQAALKTTNFHAISTVVADELVNTKASEQLLRLTWTYFTSSLNLIRNCHASAFFLRADFH